MQAEALKTEVLAELEDWARENVEIEREISKLPHATGDEAAGYSSRAERISELIQRVKTARIEDGPDLQGTIEIHVEEREAYSEPPYRYEAYADPPWKTHGTGAVVGYADNSPEAAAGQLKLILLDLGAGPDFAVYDDNGHPLQNADQGAPNDAHHPRPASRDHAEHSREDTLDLLIGEDDGEAIETVQ